MNELRLDALRECSELNIYPTDTPASLMGTTIDNWLHDAITTEFFLWTINMYNSGNLPIIRCLRDTLAITTGG